MKNFKDPIAPTKRKSGAYPGNFQAPTNEEYYSSGKFYAGDDYGVGFKTPVGTFKPSTKSAVPFGRVNVNPDTTVYEQK